MGKVKSELVSECACEVCDTLFDAARERLGYTVCERCVKKDSIRHQTSLDLVINNQKRATA